MTENGTAGNSGTVKEPTVLYLVRHCQSSGQAPDAPLTALGRQQAEQLAAWLRPLGVARIVSSTYLRAQQQDRRLKPTSTIVLSLRDAGVTQTGSWSARGLLS
jgi:2,3-bisphosphoglycerate-dependent phosphoglycerate mutase